MQAPLLPENELQRLQALRERGLLDTPAEERFDRLTRLAQQMFGCQMALVSLVDAKRQWFKSRQGLDACETGRDISFCGHAILGQDIFHVPDASQDVRFADNPLVTGAPHIRFYAGAPLRTADGYRIGTLCIIDAKPRQLNAQELLNLRDLADCVEQEIQAQRKRELQELLAASEARFRHLADNAPALIWIADTQNQGVWYNRRWLEFTGRSLAQELGMGWVEGVHPEDMENCVPLCQEAFAARRVFEIEFRLRRADGGYGWIADTGVPQFDAEGCFTGYVGYCWDISDRKQAEIELRRQQRLIEAIARAQSQFLREADRRRAFDCLLTDILDLTDSAYGFIGEVLRKPDGGAPYLKTQAITNIAWDDATRAFYDTQAPLGMEFGNLNTLFGAALTSGAPVIANNPYHDPRRGGLPAGHPALNAFLGIPVQHGGELVAMLGIANRPGGYDQTMVDFLAPLAATIGQLVEAKRDHDRRRDSERRLADVIEGTHIGTWEWNVATGETVFNERWAEIAGYTLAELAPVNIRTWSDLAHPDDLALSSALLERHFAGELDYYDFQCRMRHKLGHWVWVHDRGRVVSWTEDGKPLLMSGTHADITAQKLAEEERERIANLLGNVLAAATEVSIIATDAAGVITTFNRGAERLLGYAAKELIGQETPARFHLADEVMARGAELSALLGQPVQGFRVFVELPERSGAETHEWTYVHRDGRHIPVSLVVTTMRDESGRIIGYLGIALDITASKQAARELDQFKSTLDRTLDCVFMFDAETMKFIYFNEGALRQVGYTRQELLAMHPYDIKPEISAEQFHAMTAPLLAGERDALTFETLHRHKNGQDIPVEVFLQYFNHPGERAHFAAIVRDITERKRIDGMKNEFISTVSHELRTPLTSISGALGLIAGGALGDMPEKARQMIDIAHRNSLRLGFLINDLLDMEKLVAGKMQFNLQVQPLLPLIAQAIEANRAYGAPRRISIALQSALPDVQVRIDSERLMQVLANLLSNAIKFSFEDGTVEVGMALQENTLRVTVTDHGQGIPAAFRERIFQKFSQADASDTRQKGGTGLGLAISRELIQRMGGSIGFASEEGKGACFYFELPCGDSTNC